jgi:hypothetical protein
MLVVRAPTAGVATPAARAVLQIVADMPILAVPVAAERTIVVGAISVRAVPAVRTISVRASAIRTSVVYLATVAMSPAAGIVPIMLTA